MAAIPLSDEPSNLDRQRLQDQLSQAYASGRLSDKDFRAYSAQVWQAVTPEDLASLQQRALASAPSTELVSSNEPQWPTLADRFNSQQGAELVRRPAPTQRAVPMSFSMMGGTTQAGNWLVPDNHTSLTLMGGTEVDLREAVFDSSHVTITCIAVMGGITVIVPPDMIVQVEGVGAMGGFGWDTEGTGYVPERPANPALPVVTIRGLALMGGVGVIRKEYGQP